ncbi:MAG: hypothetical protein WA705_03000, partial [Candidatus Ozemobacteraceae bacterium]
MSLAGGFSNWLTTIESLFYRFPLASRQFLRARLMPIRRCIQRLARNIQDRRLPVSVLRRPGLTVAFVGHGAEDLFLIKRLFDEPLRPQALGSISRNKLDQRLTRLTNETDLIILCLNGVRTQDGLAGQGLVIPQYVRQVRSALLPGADPHESLQNRGNVGDLNRIRKQGYTYRISHDPSWCATFYNDFFFPYITKRHGDEAYTKPFDLFQRDFE